MEEKRKNKRLELEVSVQLERLDEENGVTMLKFIHVDVSDLSRSGIGFRSEKELSPDTYYDAKIEIWTKEVIECVIKIVRCVPNESGTFDCGGVFIGMVEADALKIDIYQYIEDEVI